MAHYHDDGTNGALLSLLMGAIGIFNYVISQVQINIYTWQIPPFLLQCIAITAGVVSITSGIVAIIKNTKNK